MRCGAVGGRPDAAPPLQPTNTPPRGHRAPLDAVQPPVRVSRPGDPGLAATNRAGLRPPGCTEGLPRDVRPPGGPPHRGGPPRNGAGGRWRVAGGGRTGEGKGRGSGGEGEGEGWPPRGSRGPPQDQPSTPLTSSTGRSEHPVDVTAGRPTGGAEWEVDHADFPLRGRRRAIPAGTAGAGAPRRWLGAPAPGAGPSGAWGQLWAWRSALRPPQEPERAMTSTAPVWELRRNRRLSWPDSSTALATVPSGVVTRVPAVT
ncbi:hypothetical protein SAMN05216371_5180 [Streptomyces sp. TLI_053]|nr:hypothetical protein SAMN05216371_5180 [Streptomyces sp. TLI_053]